MGKKVYVDANFKEVGKDSSAAAFVFNADDERLEKARKAAEARKALAAGKPLPESEPVSTDADTSVERVERPRGTK